MPTATLAFFLKDDSLVKQVRIHPEQFTAELRHTLRHIYNISKHAHRFDTHMHTCYTECHPFETKSLPDRAITLKKKQKNKNFILKNCNNAPVQDLS